MEKKFKIKNPPPQIPVPQWSVVHRGFVRGSEGSEQSCGVEGEERVIDSPGLSLIPHLGPCGLIGRLLTSPSPALFNRRFWMIYGGKAWRGVFLTSQKVIRATRDLASLFLQTPPSFFFFFSWEEGDSSFWHFMFF